MDKGNKKHDEALLYAYLLTFFWEERRLLRDRGELREAVRYAEGIAALKFSLVMIYKASISSSVGVDRIFTGSHTN